MFGYHKSFTQPVISVVLPLNEKPCQIPHLAGFIYISIFQKL